MLWKRSCCVFYGCGSEVNGYYCWHCVRVSRGKRLIAVTSWVETGVEIVFFFHPLQSDHQLVDSVGRKMWVYVRVYLCEHLHVRGCQPTCSSLHTDACTCLFLCDASLHLQAVVFTNSHIQIRKHSTGGILSWSLTKTNPVSSFFQPVCCACLYQLHK